jgi:ParB-like chromosome segregation protein Spo0J
MATRKRQRSFNNRTKKAAANALTLRTVADIRIGKRHRRDLGDIDSLAASIEDIGLLNPITVSENGLLLAGARRLAAYKRLGRKTIPVNVVRCSI